MDNIDDLDFSKTYTYADYLLWSFEERLELIKGKIFKMSPAPGGNHQTIVLNIASELYLFFKNKSHRVFAAPFDIRLVKEEKGDDEVITVVQPDVCVICDPAKLTDQRSCLGTPDIMIEVLSAGNNKKELKIKYDLYEEFGVKEYWMVYPISLAVIRYILNKDGKFTTNGRALTFGDKIITPILPGFELALDDVFRNLI
ncbi:MAG: Uma2 family endonuclease [Sphingobacteriales bacterium]